MAKADKKALRKAKRKHNSCYLTQFIKNVVAEIRGNKRRKNGLSMQTRLNSFAGDAKLIAHYAERGENFVGKPFMQA